MAEIRWLDEPTGPKVRFLDEKPKTVKDIFNVAVERAVANKSEDSGLLDETKRVFSSVNEDYLAPGVYGAPVDAANWLLKQVDLGSERPIGGSEWWTDQFRDIGASQEDYRPQTKFGQYAAAGLGGAGAGMAGGAIFGGGLMGAGTALGSPATVAAGRASITPVLDAAAGAGAGMGGQAATDIAPGSQLAQVAGQLGGAMLGGGLAAMGGAGKGPVIEAFDRTGVQPTMGSTGGKGVGYLQNNVLEQSFGGGGVVDDALKATREQMDDALRRIADQYGQPYTTAVEAGDVLKDQLAARFDMVKGAAGKVYDKIGGSFAPDETFLAKNTLDALQNPVGKVDHKALAEVLTDPKIKQLLDALQTTNGQASYATIKGLRSAVGEMLDPRQTAGVSNAQLEKLYAALSDDMAEIVSTRSPELVRQWRTANALYKDTMDKFRQHWGAFVGTDKKFIPPENAYKLLLGAGEGNYERFLSVWKGLKPGQRGNYAATILMNMGKKTADPDEAFSVARFLTNYGKLSEQAKGLLFRGTNNGPQMQALDDLLRVVKSFSSTVENTLPRGKSFPGSQFAQGAGLLQGFDMLVAGQPVAGLSAILGATAGPYAAAKLMTNPTATRALARGLAAIKAGSVPAAKIAALFQAFAAPPPKEMRIDVPAPQPGASVQ